MTIVYRYIITTRVRRGILLYRNTILMIVAIVCISSYDHVPLSSCIRVSRVTLLPPYKSSGIESQGIGPGICVGLLFLVECLLDGTWVTISFSVSVSVTDSLSPEDVSVDELLWIWI